MDSKKDGKGQGRSRGGARRGGRDSGRGGGKGRPSGGRGSSRRVRGEDIVLDPVEIPTHHLIARGEGELVKDDEGLSDLISAIRSTGRFAYDTEFIGEKTYFPFICLIQVATEDLVCIIDPLEEMDLQPFWELITEPEVEKIVHAGRLDLEPVYRFTGKAPQNVFDTQIASGFINLPHPLGLGKLIHELVGVKLDKRMTYTQWDQRPLTPAHIQYAVDDVRYLPYLRENIGSQLEKLDHMEWAAEECALYTDPKTYEFDATSETFRVRKAGSLSRRDLAVLRELVKFRDEAAREEDLPVRYFLKDEILIDLVRANVASRKNMSSFNGLTDSFKRKYGDRIIEAVQRGRETDEKDWPSRDRVEESPTDRIQIEGLWTVTMALALGQSIDAGLVTTRQEITEFYHNVISGKKHTDTPLSKGWRYKAVGRHLMRILEGGESLEIRWDAGGLRVVTD